MTPSQSVAAYEVLSPWAEADPIPLKGLAPRLDKLDPNDPEAQPDKRFRVEL